MPSQFCRLSQLYVVYTFGKTDMFQLTQTLTNREFSRVLYWVCQGWHKLDTGIIHVECVVSVSAQFVPGPTSNFGQTSM